MDAGIWLATVLIRTFGIVIHISSKSQSLIIRGTINTTIQRHIMILTLIPQTPSPFEVNINSGTRILEREATRLHTVMRTFCGVALASFIVDSESLDPTRLPPHVPALNINGIVLQSADAKTGYICGH